MNAGNEIAMTGTLIVTAIWSTVTGDTFLPSLVGAGFATYMRSQGKDGAVDRVDLLVGAAASLSIGVIAGPYIGSQLPHGDGVIGVGALIASFVSVGFFTRLHALDWDLRAVLSEIGGAIGKALQKRDGDK